MQNNLGPVQNRPKAFARMAESLFQSNLALLKANVAKALDGLPVPSEVFLGRPYHAKEKRG
jgi:hypothetical protein